MMDGKEQEQNGKRNRTNSQSHFHIATTMASYQDGPEKEKENS